MGNELKMSGFSIIPLMRDSFETRPTKTIFQKRDRKLEEARERRKLIRRTEGRQDRPDNGPENSKKTVDILSLTNQLMLNNIPIPAEPVQEN